MDNDKQDLFKDFCESYLPDYDVEQFAEKQLNRENIVLVIMLPSVQRLDAIGYYSEKITNAVKQKGLEGTVHLRKKNV